MKTCRKFFLFRALAILLLFSLASTFSNAEIVRFQQLDSRFIRGSQPETPEDFENLAIRGVKLILNLRRDESVSDSIRMAKKYGIETLNIPLSYNDSELLAKQVDAVMKILAREKGEEDFGFLQFDSPLPHGLTFVHCRQGKDRTGLIAAFYRVLFQDQSPEQAYQEWLDMGLSTEWGTQIVDVFWSKVRELKGPPTSVSTAEEIPPTAKARVCAHSIAPKS